MLQQILHLCTAGILCWCVFVNPNWYMCRADSRLAPSQWETSLQSNTVSHWLGANLESALYVCYSYDAVLYINALRPRQNGRHFADDTFKRIFLNENVRISIKISLNFVPKGPINNIPAMVQIMAWRLSGNKSLSEPMMDSLPTHICVTRPEWVNNTL